MDGISFSVFMLCLCTLSPYAFEKLSVQDGPLLGSSQDWVTAKASTLVALGNASGNSLRAPVTSYLVYQWYYWFPSLRQATETTRETVEAKRDHIEFAPAESYWPDKKMNLKVGICLQGHSGRTFYELLLLFFYLTNCSFLCLKFWKSFSFNFF